MSRKLSSGIILLLIITNIVTLIFWRNDGGDGKTLVIDNGDGQQSEEGTLATVGDKTITYDEWIDGLKEEQGKRQLKNMIEDRKSTRLNSSHVSISYAVFCLKKKNIYYICKYQI